MSLKYPDKNISAIVIAYNAELTINKVIKDIPRDYVDNIIVGDDDSSDKTFELLKGFLLAILQTRWKFSRLEF